PPASLVRFPRERNYPCPSHAVPKHRLGLAEAIGHAGRAHPGTVAAAAILYRRFLYRVLHKGYGLAASFNVVSIQENFAPLRRVGQRGPSFPELGNGRVDMTSQEAMEAMKAGKMVGRCNNREYRLMLGWFAKWSETTGWSASHEFTSTEKAAAD